jgi:hypothetical protein
MQVNIALSPLPTLWKISLFDAAIPASVIPKHSGTPRDSDGTAPRGACRLFHAIGTTSVRAPFVAGFDMLLDNRQASL